MTGKQKEAAALILTPICIIAVVWALLYSVAEKDRKQKTRIEVAARAKARAEARAEARADAAWRLEGKRVQAHNEYLFKTFLIQHRIDRNLEADMKPGIEMYQVFKTNAAPRWVEALVFKGRPRWETDYWLLVSKRWQQHYRVFGKRFKRRAE